MKNLKGYIIHNKMVHKYINYWKCILLKIDKKNEEYFENKMFI